MFNFFFVRILPTLLLPAVAVLLNGCSTLPDELNLGDSSVAQVRAGTEAPALVLQAGLGEGKQTWATLMPELAKQHLVIAFDRPGRSGAALTEAPRDPCTIADEQRTLLQNAGIQPPYILVGHSLGGLYQYVYAKRYPNEVAGIILLDPTHPRHWETMQREFSGGARIVKLMRMIVFSRADRREFDAQQKCLDQLDMAQPLTAPAQLLVSARFRPEEQGAFEKMMKPLRQNWLQLLGIKQMKVVWDSGHYIQNDSPEEVVASVQQLVSGGSMPSTVVAMDDPEQKIFAGQTTQEELFNAMGKADEQFVDAQGDEIWIYADVLEVPSLVSYIPIVGDIVDAGELVYEVIHKDRELIVQFDSHGVVKKAKVRDIE
jgi:pimeloyl-ACP methyl ester carboxylesterase